MGKTRTQVGTKGTPSGRAGLKAEPRIFGRGANIGRKSFVAYVANCHYLTINLRCEIASSVGGGYGRLSSHRLLRSEYGRKRMSVKVPKRHVGNIANIACMLSILLNGLLAGFYIMARDELGWCICVI